MASAAMMLGRRGQPHRLWVGDDLAPGARVAPSATQANYLTNVLRLKGGDGVLLFNGRDGEWLAQLGSEKRRRALVVIEPVRPQQDGPDLDYLFAPLKRARLDYVVQKATELGASRLRPVLTRRTTPERVNRERMRA